MDRALAPPGFGNCRPDIADETAELKEYFEKQSLRGETNPYL